MLLPVVLIFAFILVSNIAQYSYLILGIDIYEKELAHRYLRDYIAISCTRIIAETLVHDPYMSISMTKGVPVSGDNTSGGEGDIEGINLYLVPKIGLEGRARPVSNIGQNFGGDPGAVLDVDSTLAKKYCKVEFSREITYPDLKVSLDIQVGNTDKYFSEIYFREMEIEKILMRI